MPTASGSTWRPPDLRGGIALVAGATRGAGRGIACALGEAGATVYCTGRSTRAKGATEGRPETIEETAEMVTASGGTGIAVRVDHTVERDVTALVARIEAEQGGLDVLVNDVWGGDALTEFGKPFWELDLEGGFRMAHNAVDSHIVTARHAAPLLFGSPARTRRPGLIVEVTDGDGFFYRGNLFYDLVKTSVIRLAMAYAYELRRRNVASVAVTPGFLRSEAMLTHFGVTEATWRDGAKKDPNFIASETPAFVGRGVTALAADPQVMKRTGKVFASWTLAREFGFTDADGTRPDWRAHWEKTYGGALKPLDESFYRAFWENPIEKVWPDWP